MKAVAIIGSTGSIGTSTLDIIRMHPDKFRIVSLGAGKNAKLLRSQIREFSPDFVSVREEALASELASEFDIETGFGEEGAMRAASLEGADITVSAISGAAGLMPTLAAVRAGKRVALANKEALVMAGAILMAEAKESGAELLPVDSEHSAIFQSLTGHRESDIRRIILTASGGPFFDWPLERINEATPEQALKHPNWDMGQKVTIDSATLLNKGLEVIEASWLFSLPPEAISVAIHPQSVVHSMVEYLDGSIVSQMGTPDMKVPIAYALSYPKRIETGTEPLELRGMTLDFLEPDTEKFPCLALAYDALERGGTMPAVLNAADEVAVEAFLSGRLPFSGIAALISDVMDSHEAGREPTLEDIIAADRWAREEAAGLITELKDDVKKR